VDIRTQKHPNMHCMKYILSNIGLYQKIINASFCITVMRMISTSL
jgi:hypothetical protein